MKTIVIWHWEAISVPLSRSQFTHCSLSLSSLIHQSAQLLAQGPLLFPLGLYLNASVHGSLLLSFKPSVSNLNCRRSASLPFNPMPRSRGSDASQRQSPRVPLHLKSTACSEANAVSRLPAAADRSLKVSPRGVLQERRRGTKVVELETKLSKVQEELKKLRNRLESAEGDKQEAEQALAKAKKQVPAAIPAPKEICEEDECPPPSGDAEEKDVREQESKSEGETVTSPATMDVFEIVVPGDLSQAPSSEHEADGKEKEEDNAEETKTMIAKEAVNEDGKKKEEQKRSDAAVEDLEAKLLEKEKEVEILLEENIIFKTQAAEETKRIAGAAEAKEAALLAKLSSAEEEMEESKARSGRLADKLVATESAKATLEEEMKRLRVQTQQWRKAAEAAAAAVLADDGDEVDKHITAWRPAIRMFGKLWKKKRQHK